MSTAAKIAAMAGLGPLAGFLEMIRRLRKARRHAQELHQAAEDLDRQRLGHVDRGNRAISLAEVLAEIALESIPADRKAAFLTRLKREALIAGLGHDLERQHAYRHKEGTRTRQAAAAASVRAANGGRAAVPDGSGPCPLTEDGIAEDSTE